MHVHVIHIITFRGIIIIVVYKIDVSFQIIMKQIIYIILYSFYDIIIDSLLRCTFAFVT